MKLAFLTTSFLLISSVMAQTVSDSDNVQIVDQPKTPVIQYSSENNRMNKTFQVVLNPLGIGPSSLAATGASASYFFTRNTLLMLDYTSSSTSSGNNNSFLFFNYTGSRYELSGSSFGLHIKHFVSNSFYVRAGIDQRQVNYTSRYTGTFSNSFDYEGTFVADSTAATVAIGNQWQFENFTLGCDWFGVSVPLSHYFRSDRLTGNSISDYDRKQHDDDRKRYVTNTAVQGVRFYLGASF